ncbi:MAG: thioredoxin domain-containing protein [Ilumatobacter sp.]
MELGVEATPSFFLDGEQLQPSSFEELTAQIDAALAA